MDSALSTEGLGNLARTSPLLTAAGFRHAFFARRGGVSTGKYASLNFSSATGDSQENVLENLSRAARALGVASERVYFLTQVHGVEVHEVTRASDRERVLHREGDALVSLDPEVACGVRTADCVPVLVADRVSGGVAAIHAGWRGVAAGAVASGVAALRRLAGAEGELIAAIGPHISARAFEVSPEIAEELSRAAPGVDVVTRAEARPHVDLRRIVRHQLRQLGLAEGAIDDVPGCTVLEPGDWFSFRRDGAESGRHLSAIVAR
ncbi:MAG: peptidoglycan editing factor PgeF [Polyangiaceae bacterium]|nr:peptidoglycan editing factor PgeF [Polyangiaceae bacterium]MCW5792461.1 peptidoglycan editing factor PgeF [Polyangiaceae bacterium]